MREVLKNRSVLIIGFAESVSGVGNWITTIALFALLVFQNDGGVAESSGIFMAALLPLLIASPFAGQLCDRFDRKKLLIAGELLSGLAVIGLLLVERLEFIYVLLVVQSIVGSVITPARQSAIPSLVKREHLTRTNAFLQQLASFIKIGGPIFAGTLLMILTPRQAMILDVISFFAAALILTRLPALLPEKETESSDETRQESITSENLLTVLRESPQLTLLFMASFVALIVIMTFDIMFPVYVRDILQQNEGFFGILTGLGGLGSVVSTFYLMVRKGESDLWRDVMVGLLLLSVIPAVGTLAPFTDNLVLRRSMAIGGLFIGGIGNGMLVQISTLLQTLSPTRWLGRISGTFQSTLVAGQLVAMVLIPLIVPAVLSITLLFGMATLMLVLIVAGIMGMLHRLRSRTPQQIILEGSQA